MTYATAHRDNASNLFGLMALSAIMGAAAGLLMAPKSGKATRDDLVRKMHEAKLRTQHRAETMKDTAADKMDDIRGKTNEAIADKAADAQDMVAEARSQVEDAATEMKERPHTRRSAS